MKRAEDDVRRGDPPAGTPAGPEARVPPVVVIVEPTAVGKTGFAMRLARALDGEIVNADAFQVYRGFDIGTDKPTAEMRAAVRHHLVDVLEPTEPFSAGDFARHARAAIADIRSRGGRPIVVGGSGLYLKALLEGLAPLPRRDLEVRGRFAQRLEDEGVEALHAELATVDPETAARLQPRDRQRVLRALEVHAVSGRPMSELLREKPRDFVPLEAVQLGLTVPRGILYDRIADRVTHMVEKGWVAEVAALLSRGIDTTAPAFRAIGYQQLADTIEGQGNLDEAIADIVLATRRYAKRQLTWFRHRAGIRWLEALDLDTQLEILLQELKLRGASLDEQA